MPVRVLIICLYLSHLGRIVPLSYTLYREIMRKTPSYAKIIEEIDRSSQLRRFDTVRITAWFVVFLGCIWSMIGVLLGAPTISYVAAIAIFGSVFAAVAIRTKYHVAARSVWMLSGIFAVFSGSFVVHPAGHTDYMFTAMVGGAFLIFSLVHEKRYIFFFSVFDVFMWWLQWYVRDDITQFRVISEEIAKTYFVVPSIVTAFTVIMIELGYFAVVANQYAVRIFKSNLEAESALLAKSAFLANMSHEIRTPMNGVVGMIDILEASGLSSEQKRTLKTMRESAYSLLGIIDDILDTSKIEAGELTLTERRTEMLSSLESAVESMVAFADNKRVTLSFEFDPNLPRWITFDSGRLRQVMLNLVSNAIKFSSHDDPKQVGEVRVCVLRRNEREFEIVVSDNGIGIDEDSRSRIFQPFVQSDGQEQIKYGGTGLGLTIVKQLVELMGGQIDFSTEVGVGTTFKVILPLKDAEGNTLAPDLSGITIYGFVLRKNTAHNIERYLTCARATYVPISTEDNLADMIAPSDDKSILLVGLSGDDSSVMHEFVRQAKLEFPDLKILSFSAHRTDLMKQSSPQHKLIQWKPLLPTDLWRGAQELISPVDENANADGCANGQAADPAEFKATRILVAEDNDINQIVVEKQLLQLGYRAKIVGDGIQALDEWSSGAYDVLLTDCHMPRLDGSGLSEKIRGIELKEGRKRLPIIAITANALIGEAERCYAAGMDDYLSKPVKLAELKETIERWE